MNKLFALAITLIILGFQQQARAEYAVGAIIGDPSGLSGRMTLDANHSAEAAFAYTVGYYDGTHIHATYLRDRARTFVTSDGPIEMYYGLGARMIAISKGSEKNNVAFGPRAPIGLLYKFFDPNVEVFGEIAMAVDLMPKIDADLDVSIGARIRF